MFPRTAHRIPSSSIVSDREVKDHKQNFHQPIESLAMQFKYYSLNLSNLKGR